MIQVQALIEQVQQRGFEIVLEADRLKVRGPNPPDAETRTLLDELRRHRDEVRAILADPAPACWNCGAPMTETRDIYGKEWWACWACAKTV